MTEGFAELPTLEKTIEFIGQLLISTQLVEALLSRTLHVTFKDGILTEDDFVRKDKMNPGTLVRRIKEKLEVHTDFDKVLDVFVEQRNLFTHRLCVQDWFITDTAQGIANIWGFLAAYADNLEQIGSTLTAYDMRLGEQIQVGGNVREKLRESGYLQYLQAKYYPWLDVVLRPKTDG